MKSIVLLGDSLTAGWGLAKGENWSCQLTREYPNLSFTNCGVPGDTTTGMLSRFKSQVLEAKPDIVVLFGGLNDLNWGIDISVVASNLNSMIAQAQHHGIKPILVVTSAIDPVGALPMFGNQSHAVERLRQSVCTLSKEHSKKLQIMYGHGVTGLEIVDAYQAFEAYAEQHGYSDLYQNDGIHLSNVGAGLIFEKLRNRIAQI
ncbi:SGNH/GDSL hydrolase family protein [Vibrio sp. 10N]|uniref:SGNH/GDSL hydrolase family protein n=1 Tax=Vibrio sp. 10N TaxID=3058938 RepID=UPI002814341B|nr:SGNH/GDSL hydrolase family protein [Vibrio sp. 10N]